jgi:hypothetical protein
MWDQCTWGQTGDGTCTGGAASTHTWDAAFTQAEAANATAGGYKGYSNWRLPSKDELVTLRKLEAIVPVIDTAAFPATHSSKYWTASVYQPDLSDAWFVDFSFGNISAYNKANTNLVRLVRSGQCIHPFSILSVTVTAVGTTTAAFTATSSFAATGYWVVVPRNAQIPVPPQIKAGTTYAGVAVVASGSVAMGAGSPASVAVTGLALGSQYYIYLWPEKAGSAIPGCVAMQPLATTAISTSAIVIDPVTPTTLYAGLDGGGVYASTDSSANWSAINGGLTNLNVRALAMPNSSTLFAATYDGGVFKGSLSGSPAAWSWAACGSALDATVRLRSLIVDSTGNLYAGSETGVFKNTTACGAWTAQNTGMP